MGEEQIFQVDVDADGERDTVYIAAFCREDADRVFAHYFGRDVPSSFLTWKTVAELPDGEDALRL